MTISEAAEYLRIQFHLPTNWRKKEKSQHKKLDDIGGFTGKPL